MNHELKLVQPFYSAVESRKKTFEVRRDDRAFAEGDTVTLREWAPEYGNYTGREITREITYVLRDPRYVKTDYVIFGIR